MGSPTTTISSTVLVLQARLKLTSTHGASIQHPVYHKAAATVDSIQWYSEGEVDECKAQGEEQV